MGLIETAVAIVASATTMNFNHTDMCKCKVYINIKYKTTKEIKTDITFDVPDVEELEGS